MSFVSPLGSRCKHLKMAAASPQSGQIESIATSAVIVGHIATLNTGEVHDGTGIEGCTIGRHRSKIDYPCRSNR